MITILMHHNAYARMARDLAARMDRVRVVTMDREGLFHLQPGGEPVETPAPDVVYGSLDAWFQPKARAFIEGAMAAPRLRWFQSSSAGLDMPIFQQFGAKAEIFTSCHVQSEAMAEWALWQGLDFFRGGPRHRAQQARREWGRFDTREICNSNWLIIGFGSIGAAVGGRVRALGGRVTGVRRSGGTAPEADAIHAEVRPQDLASADVVLVCLPHSPQTAGMADAAFFAGMAEGALFLNLGRGTLVNEADLIAGLDRGKPAFAALDVTLIEPLPADSPLWSHPKVAITPHDSAHTPGTYRRTDALLLANLDRYLAGEPLANVQPKSRFA
jgi:phosphoglycerate dehydrogenase-like enzyme